MIILGNDGGTVNFGYSILKVTPKTLKFLEIGQFINTIKNLTDLPVYKKVTKAERAKAKKKGIRLTKKNRPFVNPFYESFPIYYNSVNKVFEEYKIDAIIMERFQTRGIGGPLIEMVSMMNGITTTLAHQRKATVKLTPASIWKNAVNKIYSLDDLYAYGKEFAFTPHECDSSLMALFLADAKGVMTLQTGLSKWKKAISEYAKRNS